MPEVPAKDSPAGLLPEILMKLIQQRTAVKTLLKDKDIAPSKATEVHSTLTSLTP